ncbi:helix-turn-helix domain-containing protein [Kitasatospora sp. NPDC057936]|uniref:ArsR/SmtB family transcription factor n=1 Tax=Kitasatospora sp. NPDC057936 TaxID=3346283 RepID=UPI0036DB4E52
MIRIELSAAAVARTRFAVSPLYQAMHLLFTLGRQPRAVPYEWRLRARDVIVGRRLGLLAALAISADGYTPDFLTPEPAAYRSAVEDELHLVATAPVERVRAEMGLVLSGLADLGIPARRPRALVLDALDRGEDGFAERLAGELGAFWSGVLGPHWAGLSARLEHDIARRGELTAGLGLGGMVAGLHPEVGWHDGTLSVRRPGRPDRQPGLRITGPGVIFVPGAFPPGLMLSFDPAAGRRTPVVVYPALGLAREAGERLGGSRSSILAELTRARTTADVASRVGLSPSTVSYHLQALHRGGLVRRTRRSREVYYEAVGDPAGRLR